MPCDPATHSKRYRLLENALQSPGLQQELSRCHGSDCVVSTLWWQPRPGSRRTRTSWKIMCRSWSRCMGSLSKSKSKPGATSGSGATWTFPLEERVSRMGQTKIKGSQEVFYVAGSVARIVYGCWSEKWVTQEERQEDCAATLGICEGRVGLMCGLASRTRSPRNSPKRPLYVWAATSYFAETSISSGLARESRG